MSLDSGNYFKLRANSWIKASRIYDVSCFLCMAGHQHDRSLGRLGRAVQAGLVGQEC